MRDTVVAIDIETTGLDPAVDQIIEIGAVKFAGDDIIDEWQTFVRPSVAIPHFITQLTGISETDVRDAPRIREVVPDLRRFCGTAPVLGHNVQFDLKFLNEYGARLTNPAVDTYAVASVMMPSIPRYSLRALATELDVPASARHRALVDAYMTAGVYNRLFEKILSLPLETLAEIVRSGKLMPWDGALPFEAAMAMRTREAFVSHDSTTRPEPDIYHIFSSVEQPVNPLRRQPDIIKIDPESAVDVIRPGGALASIFEDYEFRPQQAEMLAQVAHALNESRHVMVEAPTGVGKSLAYLIPAAKFAIENQDRVVVSTNTINLQEQIVERDFPLLQQALEEPVRLAVLKGRNNYLCPRRLAALRRRGATSPAEMHMLAKLLVWLTEDTTGDRGNITLRGSLETSLWSRLSAEDEGCSSERCAAQMGGSCPFYLARRRAESAHVLVVNHSLLLSDVAAQGNVLPNYRHLIVDEAHHLEGAVTNSLSFRTDPFVIQRQVAELGTHTTGLFGELLSQARMYLPEAYYSTIKDYVDLVTSVSSSMVHHVDAFFHSLRQFIEENATVSRGEYTQNIRIVPSMRQLPSWNTVEIHWDNLSQFTGGIAEAMDTLARGLSELAEFEMDSYDDLLAGIKSAARNLVDLHMRLEELVLKPDSNYVYWVQFAPDGSRVGVHAAPLDIGPLVREHIWYAKDTVIMTSATMRTGGSFSFIRKQMDAEDVDEVIVDTPFDYQTNAMLYLITDIPEPANRNAYQSAVENGIRDLCLATEGRAMVLFTSYAQLKQTVNAVSPALEQAGISVYDQTEGVSRLHLLEGFVNAEKSVLMGTRSFWEGVDVPGSDLSVLAIIRLPFSVPSDPLFAARRELYDDPFSEYALPETVLRFRQGFGRLIRRKTDRGIVAVFDRRIVSKQYGQVFLDSLPDCKITRGRLVDLPKTAKEWLNHSHSM